MIDIPAQLPGPLMGVKQPAITDEEVWLRVYCAALSCVGVSGEDAAVSAEKALLRFGKRFPGGGK